MVISGWGKFPKTNSKLFYPKSLDELVYNLNNSKVISRGMGRSYGDSAISENIIQSNNFCKISNLLDSLLDPDIKIFSIICSLSMPLIQIFIIYSISF